MTGEDFEYQESFKDKLEEFFTSPSKDNLPSILRADKEYDYLDFKSEWHEKSQLARHVLAFSNSGGGAIVIGVKEENNDRLKSEGIDDPLDESDLGNKIEKYVPDNANKLYHLKRFSYDDFYDDKISGLTFQVLFIEGAGEEAPLVAANGGKGIDEGSIYIRRNTKSIVANYEEVQSLIKNQHESRIEKETAELHEELRQLKTLYDEIDKTKARATVAIDFSGVLDSMLTTERNPNYPTKEYDEYISHLIDKKKRHIERRLAVNNIEL